jgi:hypothetical protein
MDENERQRLGIVPVSREPVNLFVAPGQEKGLCTAKENWARGAGLGG